MDGKLSKNCISIGELGYGNKSTFPPKNWIWMYIDTLLSISVLLYIEYKITCQKPLSHCDAMSPLVEHCWAPIYFWQVAHGDTWRWPLRLPNLSGIAAHGNAHHLALRYQSKDSRWGSLPYSASAKFRCSLSENCREEQRGYCFLNIFNEANFVKNVWILTTLPIVTKETCSSCDWSNSTL